MISCTVHRLVLLRLFVFVVVNPLYRRCSFSVATFFPCHSHKHNFHDSSSAAAITINPPTIVVVVRTGITSLLQKKNCSQTTAHFYKKRCLLFNQALRLVILFVCKTAFIRRRPTRLDWLKLKLLALMLMTTNSFFNELHKMFCGTMCWELG